MTADPIRIDCFPEDSPLAEELVVLAARAVRRLGLDAWLNGIALYLDDLSPCEWAWMSFDRLVGGDGARKRRKLILYLHPDELLRDRLSTRGLMPGDGSWQNLQAPKGEITIDPDQFSARKAERFLYHQLLFGRDLCSGRISTGNLPARLAASFQEAWAVNVDGRLRLAHLPGWSTAERRRRFYRAFSVCGVLVPEHWRIFHELWEGDELTQDAVLRMLRRLPALRRE